MSSTATTQAPTPIDSKKPTTKQELIAANIKLLIEQLESGHSDALTNYLTSMSRFHNYSFGNVLEIARQMPTATRVAGFWSWKNLGRSVNAGAKGIRILAPIVGVKRKKDSEAQKDITKQNERTLLGFRNTYVFDISQTNGVDLPEMHQVSGDPGENIDRLAAFLKGQGIQLVYNPKIAPALGMSYGGRIAAHVAGSIASKPELVQISTTYGAQKEGSPVLPRNKYTAIRDDRPKSKEDAKRPEFKECKFTTEAIITEGADIGTIHKVCASATCPIHHPQQRTSRDDEKSKAEQERQRIEQAVANATGIRVLTAIGSAVPVRLLKRDLLFVIEKLLGTMDESRTETLARQLGIRLKRDDGGIAKTLIAFARRADEGTLSRLLVEASILLASSRGNPTSVLRDAASTYKVDTEAITLKVKQEFAAKAKKRKEAKPVPKIKKAA